MVVYVEIGNCVWIECIVGVVIVELIWFVLIEVFFIDMFDIGGMVF